MADSDVAPLPLDGDEDFFSDLGSEVTSPPRLVINHSDYEVHQRAPHSRANPFSNDANQIVSENNRAPNHRDTYKNHNQNQNRVDSDSEEIGSHPSVNHCHVSHKHDSDNTVRNQLIAICVVTLVFMIGEGIGELSHYFTHATGNIIEYR